MHVCTSSTLPASQVFQCLQRFWKTLTSAVNSSALGTQHSAPITLRSFILAPGTLLFIGLLSALIAAVQQVVLSRARTAAAEDLASRALNRTTIAVPTRATKRYQHTDHAPICLPCAIQQQQRQSLVSVCIGGWVPEVAPRREVFVCMCSGVRRQLRSTLQTANNVSERNAKQCFFFCSGTHRARAAPDAKCGDTASSST